MLTLEGLELAAGEFRLRADWALGVAPVTAVIGPSGGGKSTLLSAIAGFLPPQSGRILWGAHDVTQAAPAARPVSMLFQDNNLFPHLTAAQNVGLGVRPTLRLMAGEVEKVTEALRVVGLADLQSRKPGALSGGQQSRVALARVLVADRPLVLMDEPFSALGPGLRHEMLDLAQSVLAGSGRELMMVTHDPGDAQRVADQVCFVDGGIAQPPVATAAFFDQPTQALRDYLGDGV